ncbi:MULTISPECIES: conjugal transfer pilus assembly protein TraU [Vibrio]|uniref:conjugal transfer pilus assembly protein TraU n=1 Tax=Vibrio TaxID=662 RepID=UPI0001B93F97|nr:MULTISPECIES: conjugal transfer pilus assembly protein TraU [Vibrio]EEX34487.1 IncF plasmid conjugative transfer pilus assembly protein TraU [Vibrio coralliilyticus ATCC BAA-450]MDE3898524.1 conjugal transfer pilus assembly protein TraU [Vibrio sp. CC007]
MIPTRRLQRLALLLTVLMVPITVDAGAVCSGHFINPLRDVCWRCLLPITLGSVPVFTGPLPDTPNPSSPLSLCPAPPPVMVRLGLNIGYWEPYALTDVTRVPFCMVNLGVRLHGAHAQRIGGRSTSREGDSSDGGFYHAHWYRYPLIAWLHLLESGLCMETRPFDIGYFSELDPLWHDDALAFALNPEAVLFGHPAAQLACASEAIATHSRRQLPMDRLFWCLGAQGSAYPLTGNTNYRDSPIQAATLIMERLNYKLHRQGMVFDSQGRDGAVCQPKISPFLPKSRYRYQMSAPIADAAWCHPYTTSTTVWEMGHDNPTTGDNFGFVQWRKRNCVLL